MPIEAPSTKGAGCPQPPVDFSQFRQPSMTRYNPNAYEAQILAKGRDLPTAPAPKATYPRTIGGRTFQTEADYQEALADFLNGM
jgi:hypothetical protein